MIFYLIILSFYRLIIKLVFIDHEIYVWGRNSLYTSYFKFLKSDLDITIYSDNLNKCELEKLTRLHTKIKKIIPVLGEIVIWTTVNNDSLTYLINKIELKRDPILNKLLNISFMPKEEEKILFLTKFLASNYYNWKKLSLRQDKVNYYFAMGSIENAYPRNWDGLIKFLANKGHIEVGVFEKEIEEIFSKNFILKNDSISTYVYALFFNKIFYLRKNADFSIVEKEIILENIKWEIWGLYSNQFFYPTGKIKIELERMMLIARPIIGDQQYFILLEIINNLGFNN